MHRSHLPITYWFWAAYLMGTLTPGISALQLQRQLGIGSYRTALYMCRRLRRAMVNPKREPLKGIVEMDEAFVGGEEKTPRGYYKNKMAIVGVAVENRGNHSGRIRLEHLKDTSRATIHAFVKTPIATGSQVRTDGGWPYLGIETYGYQHVRTVLGEGRANRKKAGQALPWVHRVISNLKTWLLGTHHGVDNEHLQEYLDEFVFRYNRRRIHPQSFLTLLILTTQGSPWPRSLTHTLSASSA
jgi:ISXO2 transposase-like protein